jgi:predicted HicB family RNase H-like nuclease
MEMSGFTDQVRLDLGTLGRLGGPDVETAVERVVEPFELTLRNRFLDALTVMASELNIDLPGGHVEVRVDADSVALAYVQEQQSIRETREELDSRVTLRIPEPLKNRMESAAAADHVSVNSWLLHLIEGRSASGYKSTRQLQGRGKS